jgi:hypothetical protein
MQRFFLRTTNLLLSYPFTPKCQPSSRLQLPLTHAVQPSYCPFDRDRDRLAAVRNVEQKRRR